MSLAQVLSMLKSYGLLKVLLVVQKDKAIIKNGELIICIKR